MTTVSLRFKLEPSAAPRTNQGTSFLSLTPSITHGAVIPLQRRAPTKVIVFQWPLGTRPIKRSPRTLATTHPHHFRIGGGLVDEDQPGRVKQAPLPHPAPTRPRHVGALLSAARRLFLNVMS